MTTTGNDLAVRNGSIAHQQAALAIKPGQTTWDKFQEAALSQIGLKDAPNADRAVFLHQCQRTGLDPFAKQIMMIPRKEWDAAAKQERIKWTIQTGIEGWRVIRDRAEKREGLRGILSRFTYYDHDDNERKVWTRADAPAVAEVTYTVVEATGREVPYTSQLRFDEYIQVNKDGKPMAQWAVKPVHMLEKCTEADVYRRAFPQDYSGIELSDAMPPAEDITPAAPKVTGAEIRNRRPQQVRSQVVPPEDAPWPGDAAPARGARNADRETGEVIPGTEDDPRADVLAAFDALKVAGPEIPGYLTRLAGRSLASVESLNRKQAQWFVKLLAPIGSRDELEAAAVAAEERRAQDNAAEAGDSEEATS